MSNHDDPQPEKRRKKKKKNLYPVRGIVVKANPTEVVQDGVIAVILHVVGHHRGKGIPLHRKHSPLEQHRFLGGEDRVSLRHVTPRSLFKDPDANLLLDALNGVLELLHHSLTFQGIYVEALGLGAGNEEGDHGDRTVDVLESLV